MIPSHSESENKPPSLEFFRALNNSNSLRAGWIPPYCCCNICNILSHSFAPGSSSHDQGDSKPIKPLCNFSKYSLLLLLQLTCESGWSNGNCKSLAAADSAACVLSNNIASSTNNLGNRRSKCNCEIKRPSVR